MEQLSQDLMQYIINKAMDAQLNSWREIQQIYCSCYNIAPHTPLYRYIENICVQAVEDEKKAHDAILEALGSFSDKIMVPMEEAEEMRVH